MLRRRRRRWRRKRGSYKMLISWHAHTTCVLPPLLYPLSYSVEGSSPGWFLSYWTATGAVYFVLFIWFSHFFTLFRIYIFCFYHILWALIKGKVQWTKKILWRVDALKKWNEFLIMNAIRYVHKICEYYSPCSALHNAITIATTAKAAALQFVAL